MLSFSPVNPYAIVLINEVVDSVAHFEVKGSNMSYMMNYGLALQRQIYSVYIVVVHYPETQIANWIAFFIELRSCCAISTCVVKSIVSFTFSSSCTASLL